MCLLAMYVHFKFCISLFMLMRNSTRYVVQEQSRALSLDALRSSHPIEAIFQSDLLARVHGGYRGFR